jgi:hypothetical protein
MGSCHLVYGFFNSIVLISQSKSLKVGSVSCAGTSFVMATLITTPTFDSRPLPYRSLESCPPSLITRSLSVLHRPIITSLESFPKNLRSSKTTWRCFEPNRTMTNPEDYSSNLLHTPHPFAQTSLNPSRNQTPLPLTGRNQRGNVPVVLPKYEDSKRCSWRCS